MSYVLEFLFYFSILVVLSGVISACTRPHPRIAGAVGVVRTGWFRQIVLVEGPIDPDVGRVWTVKTGLVSRVDVVHVDAQDHEDAIDRWWGE